MRSTLTSNPSASSWPMVATAESDADASPRRGKEQSDGRCREGDQGGKCLPLGDCRLHGAFHICFGAPDCGAEGMGSAHGQKGHFFVAHFGDSACWMDWLAPSP